MSKEWTPTTEQVREIFLGFRAHSSDGAEFDRWLDLVKRDWYEEGYRDGTINGIAI